MNCLILEDQQILLDLLGAMVDCFSEIRTVFKAINIKHGKEIIIQHKIDIAILDLYLPDGNGLDVAMELKSTNPNIKLVFLSGAAEEFICPKDLIELTYGIIDKADAFDSLRLCLYDIIEPIHDKLTNRQKEIYKLIGLGKTTKEIATVLGSSPSTIETHRKAISRNLRCSGSELISNAALIQNIEKYK